MIKELNSSDFYLCQNLLNLNGQIEAIAVVRGLAPGRIFVDDTKNPKTALIWLGNNDGFIFIGNENNELFNSNINSFIDNVIKIEANEVDLDVFECIGNHSNWYSVIEKTFEHRKLESWDQYVFQLNDNNQNKLKLDDAIETVSIKDIFTSHSKKFSNVEFVRDKIEEFWLSLDDFINSGIGFCSVSDGVIVSMCFSGFVVDSVHCVGIETLDQYRGKGYALAALQAFVNECSNLHYTIYWDCMKSNIPSVKLAKRIGCELTIEYKGYYFMF